MKTKRVQVRLVERKAYEKLIDVEVPEDLDLDTDQGQQALTDLVHAADDGSDYFEGDQDTYDPIHEDTLSLVEGLHKEYVPDGVPDYILDVSGSLHRVLPSGFDLGPTGRVGRDLGVDPVPRVVGGRSA